MGLLQGAARGRSSFSFRGGIQAEPRVSSALGVPPAATPRGAGGAAGPAGLSRRRPHGGARERPARGAGLGCGGCVGGVWGGGDHQPRPCRLGDTSAPGPPAHGFGHHVPLSGFTGPTRDAEMLRQGTKHHEDFCRLEALAPSLGVRGGRARVRAVAPLGDESAVSPTWDLGLKHRGLQSCSWAGGPDAAEAALGLDAKVGSASGLCRAEGTDTLILHSGVAPENSRLREITASFLMVPLSHEVFTHTRHGERAPGG